MQECNAMQDNRKRKESVFVSIVDSYGITYVFNKCTGIFLVHLDVIGTELSNSTALEFPH